MLEQEQVVLVDEENRVLGVEEKIKAHELGLLHRAFSVFIYRKIKKGGFCEALAEDSIEFLLQRRHKNKYHCGGLWTNTCCSHPRLNEDILLAGQRRLKEEMAIEVPLAEVGTFQYRAEFENGLTEHEFDHVLMGEYNGLHAIVIDSNEVQDFRWIAVPQLMKELSLQETRFTPWFKPALSLVLGELCISC